MNLLSPHPWVAWTTALAALTLAAWRDRPGVVFVAAFYLMLVGAKIVVALRVAGVLLVGSGAALVVEFGRGLL